MKISKLNDMKKGWFVGDFNPTVLKTRNAEVAVKLYKKGEFEERHYHKVATEITVIISGAVLMNGTEFSEGDIITIDPYESTDFRVLKDAVTVVVKCPGELDDKYDGEYRNV